MISVIIPVYKNTEEFIHNLRKNLPFLKGDEVIVVNDDPGKSIKDDLKPFKEITLIENQKNLGFSPTVNAGVNHSKGEFIFLLNSDVILKDSSYRHAVEQLERKPELFAISFAQIEKDGSTVGKNKFYWKLGFFYHEKAPRMSFGFNGWAEGGSCVINKDKFLELDGFDPLYAPFYWEDIDLSYRAWKKGYKVVFDPSVLVEHHHSGTINKYIANDFKNIVAARNHYTFIWKNISDTNLITQHILFLPYNLLYFVLKGNTALFKGFFKALVRLPAILKSRSKNINVLTDKEVLQKFKN